MSVTPNERRDMPILTVLFIAAVLIALIGYFWSG